MSADVLCLGAGERACRGRFFAAWELKLMFAHIMMRLAKEGLRPTDLWLSILRIPDTRAKVFFRQRRFQPPI